MWSWSLDWAEVSTKLLVGSCPMRPADVRRIHRESGASAMLSLQHDDCLAYWGIDYAAMVAAGKRCGMTMRRCPMRDFDIEDQRRRLAAAIAVLNRLQRRGHRTYVHCTAGLGRSPLTVLGYLTFVQGMPVAQALESIRRVRPGSVPSLEALYGCRDALLQDRHEPVTDRAYALYLRGVPGPAERHWHLAQQQLLQELFSQAEDETDRTG
jgi:hypothetical protein